MKKLKDAGLICLVAMPTAQWDRPRLRTSEGAFLCATGFTLSAVSYQYHIGITCRTFWAVA